MLYINMYRANKAAAFYVREMNLLVNCSSDVLNLLVPSEYFSNG